MEFTILAVDIKGYSDSGDAEAMETQRRALNELFEQAADNTRIKERYHEARKSHIDTGDGFYVSMDTQDYRAVLSFLDETRRLAKTKKGVRARAVCHSGECERTLRILENHSASSNGDITYVGEGLNEAARLVNSDVMRDFVESALDEWFVFGLSRRLYERIRDQRYMDQRSFTEYTATEKNYTGSLFICGTFQNRPKQKIVIQCVDTPILPKFQSYLDSSLIDQYLENRTGASDSKLYVFPELSRLFEHKFGNERFRANEFFNALVVSPRNTVVRGSEQSGKTELAKEVFRLFHQSGAYLPIFLRFNEEYSGGVQNKLTDSIHEQYGEIPENLESLKKYVLIDDFHLVRAQYHERILDELDRMPNLHYILFVDSDFSINFMKKELLEEHEIVSIEEFSHSMRSEFIEMWMERNNISEKNFELIDSYTDFVNTALLKGLIPSVPVNIIVILTEKMTYNPLSSTVTSRGHCYQTLIYIALKKASIAEAELDIYLNILENLSFHLYSREQRYLDDSGYSDFLSDYRLDYNLPITDTTVKNTLSKSRIFSVNDLQEYSFTNKFMFYFFVACYLAHHKNEKSIRSRIDTIYGNLDRNENGYIGIFIVHHVKDKDILDEIVLNLMVFYEKFDEATLSDDETKFFLGRVGELGSITMSLSNSSRANRKKELDMRDQDEKQIASMEEEHESMKSDSEFDIDQEFLQLKKALKTSEVMGHILKSRTGSFRLADQRSYFEQAIKLYLRITYRFLSDFRDNKEDFINFFEERIRGFHDRENMTKEKIWNLSTRFYLEINLLNYASCIIRVTNTLTSKQILEVVQEVCNSIGTPLARLIQLHASMWLKKQVPTKELKAVYQNGSALTKRLVQRLVVQYCDMHDIDSPTKQRLSTLFDINLPKILVSNKQSTPNG